MPPIAYSLPVTQEHGLAGVTETMRSFCSTISSGRSFMSSRSLLKYVSLTNSCNKHAHRLIASHSGADILCTAAYAQSLTFGACMQLLHSSMKEKLDVKQFWTHQVVFGFCCTEYMRNNQLDTHHFIQAVFADELCPCNDHRAVLQAKTEP